MTKSLQKPANRLRELKLPHPGILDLQEFDKHFELHCYKPSSTLQPFIAHIWTQRRRPTNKAYQPTEVLSGPNLYLFITAKEAFIHGVAAHKFMYETNVEGVIAGVKFQPGGFYPFAQCSLIDLAGKTVPASTFFPEIDAIFIKKLLASPDERIIATLDGMLKSKQPVRDNNIYLINKILKALNEDESLNRVRDIAKTVGRSERTLQLLFHTHVGASLKWVIIRRRLLNTIQKVCSKKTITWTEAAVEQGYSSQSHFTREFKEVIGLSPSQYLKKSSLSHPR